MDNQQPQQPAAAAPQPTPVAPQQPQKKSNAPLIIALIVIFVGLPILFIVFFFMFVVNVVEAAPEIATEIEKGINEIERTSDTNYVAGTWHCAKGTGSASDRENFTTTLKLNKDMTFTYGQYGDLSNNHYAGTYTFKDEDKHTQDNSYSYYMVDFDTDEMVEDGEEKDPGKGISQMEMGITKTSKGKEAITIFTSSYNMYYCYNDN